MFMLETVKHVTITYNFGDLADWISAFATFLAVIVSLYLANRRDLPKIHFSVLKKDNSIRITNKSYQIVELMLKTDDDKNYIKIALPPLKVDNPNMRDEEPFNHGTGLTGSYYYLSGMERYKYEMIPMSIKGSFLADTSKGTLNPVGGKHIDVSKEHYKDYLNHNLHGGAVKVMALVVLLVLLETGGVTYFWFYVKEMEL